MFFLWYKASHRVKQDNQLQSKQFFDIVFWATSFTALGIYLPSVKLISTFYFSSHSEIPTWPQFNPLQGILWYFRPSIFVYFPRSRYLCRSNVTWQRKGRKNAKETESPSKRIRRYIYRDVFSRQNWNQVYGEQGSFGKSGRITHKFNLCSVDRTI